MSLYNTYNNEDIISRAVIAGMLGVLNNNVTYNQVWSNTEIEEVKVPWYYNMSGDERFMQDFYTHYADCDFPKPADGNFDKIPRGVITYTGADIDSARITNRFVQGRYVKEVDGKLQSFVSFLYSIPLTVRFDCELWVETQNTALKVEQAIREVFYKTTTFYVYYKGMRLGCTAGFSENYAVDKIIDYSFEEDNRIKITFTIEVETYQPVFDPTTEMNANNYMRGVGYRIYDHNEKSDGEITMVTPRDGTIIPKETPLMIEWSYIKEGAIIDRVDAYWQYTNSNDWQLIEKGVDNHEFWYWNIPKEFTDYKEPIIIWEETDDVAVYREPKITITPDLSTGIINAASFNVIDEGYFSAPSDDASMHIILEMRNTSNRVVYTGDTSIYVNILNYKVNTANPITIVDDVSIVFPGEVDYKEVDIIIANSVNNDVWARATGVNII
jgi:hypothetical protein